MAVTRLFIIIVVVVFNFNSVYGSGAPLLCKLANDRDGNYVIDKIGTDVYGPNFTLSTGDTKGYDHPDKRCYNAMWYTFGVGGIKCNDLNDGFTSFKVQWAPTLGFNTFGNTFFLLPMIAYGINIIETAHFEQELLDRAVESAKTNNNAAAITKKADEVYNHINAQIIKFTEESSARLERIRNGYIKDLDAKLKQINIVTQIVDETGLWKDDALLIPLNVNTTPLPDLAQYLPKVNYTFKVTTVPTSEIYNELDRQMSNFESQLALSKNQQPELENKYDLALREITSYASLKHSEYYHVGGFKIIVDAPTKIVFNEKTQNIIVTYRIIKSADQSPPVEWMKYLPNRER